MRTKKIMTTLCLLATFALATTGCDVSANSDGDTGTTDTNATDTDTTDTNATDTIDTGTGDEPTDTGFQCGLSLQDRNCNSCMETSCCDEAQACADATGDSCLTLNECLMTCTYADWDDCSQACADATPDGLDSYNGLMTCLSGPCDAACNDGATTDTEETPTDTDTEPTTTDTEAK